MDCGQRRSLLPESAIQMIVFGLMPRYLPDRTDTQQRDAATMLSVIAASLCVSL